MDATTELQFEPMTLSVDCQRAAWQDFANYGNGKYRVEAGIPAPVTDLQPVKRIDDGWTTTFHTTADDVADTDTEDESDGDASEVDSAHKRRWLKAIFALLGGSKHSVAAKEAGVSNRQLSRWKVDPQFVELYQTTKAEVFRDSVNGMKGVL